MSRDIRSFFSVISKKPDSSKTIPTKKRAVIDSSDEDIIEASPVPVKKITAKPKKRKVIDSDSDDENKKGNKISSKNGSNEKIKKTSAVDVFGSAPVKQTKIEKKEEVHVDSEDNKKTLSKKVKDKVKVKPKLETELGIHDDPDFEQSLLDLDNDILLDNVNVLDKTIEEALNNKDVLMSASKKCDTLQRKRKLEDEEDTGIDKDQERYEKRRHSSMLYQKYLNRSGPAHHGAKEYPKGKADCLKGLCFLRTGVLDSLEGEEFQTLIHDHGGRTVKAVSKKINYLVVGEDAGPAKLEKARTYGIPTISEDELLDMILKRSGMQPKYVKGTGTENEEIINSTPEEIEERVSSPKKSVEKKIEKEETRSDMQPKNGKDSNDRNQEENAKISSKKPVDKKSEKEEIIVEKKLRRGDGDKPNLKKLSNTSKEDKSESHHKQRSKPVIPEVKKENFYNKTSISQPIDKEKTFKEEIPKTSNENLSWADKYKPKDIKTIIGQQGDKSNMKKLLLWLSKWQQHHCGKEKPKLVKPSPWAKSDDGAYFKCALLSGPPGVGKTTTATLVAKELGFDIVELNASDTRSKKSLNQEVSQLLSTNSLAGFLKDGSAPTRKHVLLMDEVDGMAGNEDRGGMQELILLIKSTSVPIICMCNDRNHAKVRSLANYCFDLRFSKPRLEQIRGAMMSVCFKEGLKMTPEALGQIISGTEMDIRQTLNHLSMWTVNNKSLSAEEAHTEAAAAKKDTLLGPWEVVRKVFSEQEQKTMTVADKFRLFFYDYSIGPLFVQENYLQVQPHCPKEEFLQRAANAADAISTSDLVDKKMRTCNNWSLLEVQAIYSSVLPGHYMSGHIKGQINFPGWLGKNSKKGKCKRLVSELQSHMRMSTSGSRKAVNLDYIYYLRDHIIRPMVKEGANGIEQSLSAMHSYNLLRQDLDSILEVSHWARQKDPMAMVDSKVKAAFTRAYNKDNVKLPYAVSTGAVKKKARAQLDDDPYNEEEIESSPEDDDDITKDAMIKAKKKQPSKTKSNDTGTTASSKKAGSSSKGKGSKKTK